MDIKLLILNDPDVLGGTPVFSGTRVPIETLFDHLEAGVSLDEFLEDFPTVSRDQAVALLTVANKILDSRDHDKLYVLCEENKKYFMTALKIFVKKIFRNPIWQFNISI